MTTRKTRPRLAGVLLAAGSGTRFGSPKALADTGDGPWVLRGLATLGGLHERVVVVGAAADAVTALLPADVTVVHNPDHETGMGSSLRVALNRWVGPQPPEPAPPVDAVIVMLVDLPDVPRAAVTRLAALASDRASARSSLARATYHGRPGHPVLIGADHFAGVAESAGGDRGARDYLARHVVVTVECGDLAAGRDVDRPPAD